MRHFIVVGAGLLGGVVGFAISAAFAIWLAKAYGVSAREGAHGYLGIVAGIGGGLIALVLSMILALRLQGVNNAGSLITGTLGGGLTIVVLAAIAIGFYWQSVPSLLNRQGASPQMYFEIIPPAGFEAEPSTLRASLNCNSQERPEVYLSHELEKSEAGQTVLSGRVELYYRASCAPNCLGASGPAPPYYSSSASQPIRQSTKSIGSGRNGTRPMK